MFRIPVWLLLGLLTCTLTSCLITCPDGRECPNHSTCCVGEEGYSCCFYPQAVCCSDKVHCCPSGFRCNMTAGFCERENKPWMSMPMVKKEAAVDNSHIRERQKSSVVFCDNHWACADGTTCCRHPKGGWFCCPLSPARCCLDGYHCCPYGYDCDHTYTRCVREGLTYPFTPEQPAASRPAFRISISEDEGRVKETPMAALTEASDGTNGLGIIRCDSMHYCPTGTTCCKGLARQWSCCPYPLGQCCLDGRHCCEYGYTCDPLSQSCRRFYSQIPAGTQQKAKADRTL
ncbi:progranulin-like [Sphaeramia orbicularis]|uniref:Progranulin-like n=1 Tax=Sphaeramia orbicularis TaxID=375764 RepID=A0A672ZT11_9TELE|nr:progranulin-like [Sphaeramia orbicularis]